VTVEDDKIVYESALEGMANCDTSKYVVVQQPKHGTIIIHDNGYYTYIANDDFVGKDSFTYKASEDSACEPCCVTIQADIENSQKAQMPSNLTIEETNCDGVYRFNWSDNSDNEDSFVIYQDGKPIYITCPNQITQELTLELDEDKEYKFEVASMNEKGISSKSGINFRLNSDFVELTPKIKDAKIISTIDVNDSAIITPAILNSKSNNEDNVLYLSELQEGVKSFDITDPSNPVELSTLDQNAVLYFSISNDNKYLYTSTAYAEFFSVDISDPANIKEISKLDKYISTSLGVFSSIDDRYIFVPAESNGLNVVDISDPSNLKIAKIYDDINPIFESNWTVSNDHKTLYMHGYKKISIFNIEDPLNITTISEVTYDDDAKALEDWNKSYSLTTTTKDNKTKFSISEEDDKILNITDISDPNNPVLLKQVTLSDKDKRLYVSQITLSNDENLLFVSTGSQGLKIIELYR
jgi:hypothetical protein